MKRVTKRRSEKPKEKNLVAPETEPHSFVSTDFDDTYRLNEVKSSDDRGARVIAIITKYIFSFDIFFFFFYFEHDFSGRNVRQIFFSKLQKDFPKLSRKLYRKR